jgi:proteasome lid subunit RPN8/RPN11
MLLINDTIKRQLVDDALRTYPDECCGFLLGADNGDERTIEEAIVIQNAKEGDKRRRFEITPADYLKAEQYAEANSLTLLGVYHSHPDHPSVPSEHDRIAAQPFFSYIIIAVQRNECISIQSWQLNDDFQFEEEKILFTNTVQSFIKN